MSAFALRVDDEIDLVLREPWTTPAVVGLIERNLDRLRPWEPWAQDYPGAQRETEWARRALHEWAEGRGVVTRAGKVLIEYLFEQYPVVRIEILVAAHNLRSRAVAERLGFVHEGTLRAAFPVGDDRHDEAVYALLRSDRHH